MNVIAVTALAFLIGLALAIYTRRRKQPKVPEFDGGFRHNNPARVTTIIYSSHVKQKDHL
jgi:hypothetical protein